MVLSWKQALTIGKLRVIDQVLTVLGRSLEALWFGSSDAAEAGGVHSTALVWPICVFTITEHFRHRHCLRASAVLQALRTPL